MMSITKHKIVLDLDATLVCTIGDVEKLKKLGLDKNEELKDRIYYLEMVNCVVEEGTGEIEKTWGVFRPFAFEFLEFAQEYFEEIYIWSAGKNIYVHSIVSKFFNKRKYYPSKILTSTDCECDSTNYPCYKPLVGHFDITQTFALDDKDETFSKNKENGILIPPYSVTHTYKSIMSDDIHLLQLKYWLLQKEVMNCTDIRLLDKSKIFKTSIDDYLKKLKNE